MTMTVDIGNQALDLCRARATVTSIFPSDGTLAGDVLARQFWPRIDALFRSAQWNCARFQTQLTLLRAMQGTDENTDGSKYGNPPSPWLYEYAMPTGSAFSVTVPANVSGGTQTVNVPAAPLFLRGRFIVPTQVSTSGTVPIMTGGGLLPPVALGAMPPVPFLIGSDLDAASPTPNQMKVLLTNAQQATLCYTARVTDPSLWDAGFTQAAVATLAAWIEQPLTGSNQLTQMLVQIAQGFIQEARVSDGDEGTTMVDNVPDWMSARSMVNPGMVASSSYTGRLYDSMSFPGGVVFTPEWR